MGETYLSENQDLLKGIKRKVEDDLVISKDHFNFNDVTIVIPTLNEENAIGIVLESVLQEGYEKILVVDGNSTDNTLNNIKPYGIECIIQEGKGKTGAIKTAINHIKTPYFIMLDGDCTYSAKDIENLLSHIGEKYEVIGTRTKGRENISPLNRFGNLIINKVFNLIFGTIITDVCSGMYMLDTKFAKDIIFETKGFDVEVEIAAHAAYNHSIVETPIEFLPRIGIQKLRPFEDGAKILYRIFRMGLKFHPTRMLCLLSIFMFIPGITLLGLHVCYRPQLQSFLFGLIMVTLAIQGITLYIVDTKLNNIHMK